MLPNWDQAIREPRTRELWWRGVAPSSRAKVWDRAVGNDLGLTDMTYDKALQRVKEVETRMLQARPEERFKEKAWFGSIRRDIQTVFPELKIFQAGGPLHDGLLDVLMAYAMYRSDVGYRHGTHVSCISRSLCDGADFSNSSSRPFYFSLCLPRPAPFERSPIFLTDLYFSLSLREIRLQFKKPTTWSSL